MKRGVWSFLLTCGFDFDLIGLSFIPWWVFIGISVFSTKHVTETLRLDSVHLPDSKEKLETLCGYVQAKRRLQHSHQPLSINPSMIPHLLPSSVCTTIKRYVLHLQIRQFFLIIPSFLRNISSKMANSPVLLTDLKAGHCTSAIEVRLLWFWEEARYGKRRANGGWSVAPRR